MHVVLEILYDLSAEMGMRIGDTSHCTSDHAAHSLVALAGETKESPISYRMNHCIPSNVSGLNGGGGLRDTLDCSSIFTSRLMDKLINSKQKKCVVYSWRT